MAGLLKPVASLNGLPCSGHGIPIPSTIHTEQPCKTPPKTLGIVVKNLTCFWPPTPLVPLTAVNPSRATVLVNGIPIMISGDTFTPHISATTNIINYICPCGNATCIIPTPFACSILTTEDKAGTGHSRTAVATSTKTLAFKVPIVRMLDPLGVGASGKSYPCSSVVAYGSPTVLAS